MNIEKYNERRKAKIAKLQVEALNKKEKRKDLFEVFQTTVNKYQNSDRK